MSEHSELWKHQNNPAGTESVSIFRALKLDTVRKKEKLYCTKHCGQRLASESEGGRETLHHLQYVSLKQARTWGLWASWTMDCRYSVSALLWLCGDHHGLWTADTVYLLCSGFVRLIRCRALEFVSAHVQHGLFHSGWSGADHVPQYR